MSRPDTGRTRVRCPATVGSSSRFYRDRHSCRTNQLRFHPASTTGHPSSSRTSSPPGKGGVSLQKILRRSDEPLPLPWRCRRHLPAREQYWSPHDIIGLSGRCMTVSHPHCCYQVGILSLFTARQQRIPEMWEIRYTTYSPSIRR